VTTNVPGPPVPLYALGRRCVEIIPYVPIASRLRLGIAMFTYAGSLTFGVTGDYDAAADLWTLAGAIEDGLAALVRAAHDRAARDDEARPPAANRRRHTAGT
jgi:diacylglycerol O-acyltransferase